MGLFSRKKNKPVSNATSSQEVPVENRDLHQEEGSGSSEHLPTESATATGVPTQDTAGAGLKSVVEKMRAKAEGQVTLSLSQTGNEMSYTLYQRGQEIEAGTIEPGSEWFSSVADLYVEEEQGERGAWTRALIVVNPAIGRDSAVHVSLMNTEASRTHNLNYALDLSHLVAQTSEADSHDSSESAEERLNRVSARLASEDEPAGAHSGSEPNLQEPATSEPAAFTAEAREEPADEPSQTPIVQSEALDHVSAPASAQSQETPGAQDSRTDHITGGYVAQRFARAEEEPLSPETEAPERHLSSETAVSTEPALSEAADYQDENLGSTSLQEAPEAVTLESTADSSARELVEEPLGAVHSESASQHPATGGHFEEASALGATEESLEDSAQVEQSTYNLGEATSPEPVSDVPAFIVPEHEADRISTGDHSLIADDRYASEDLPSHIDDSEFGTDDEPAPAATTSASVLPTAPSKIAAATLDAPMTGSSVDVAPSYSEQSYAKPSETKKADGNLILTEAEVVSRLAPAYDTLFGAHGTALDVSTVLIRVRTLGSYYDALTHVRRNGFWEQVRTFDLIPEDVLGILQLKADSYKEGYGSPLAINLRFTPGIPVLASFDYADEEAFVRYPEHLPAQQYVEELRMFPRTGANIPAHMSEALASWNF